MFCSARSSKGCRRLRNPVEPRMMTSSAMLFSEIGSPLCPPQAKMRRTIPKDRPCEVVPAVNYRPKLSRAVRLCGCRSRASLLGCSDRADDSFSSRIRSTRSCLASRSTPLTPLHLRYSGADARAPRSGNPDPETDGPRDPSVQASSSGSSCG